MLPRLAGKPVQEKYLAPDALLRTGAYAKTYTKRSAVYYETIFIVNPDISQENTEQLTDDLVAKVEKAGGRIVKRENWGSRPLAYSIANRKRGHYLLLVTDGEPAALKALEHAISLEERVIRSLTTKLTELSDEPSPLIRRKTAKPEEAKAEEAKPEESGSDAAEVVAEAKEESAEKAATAKKAEAPAKKAPVKKKAEAGDGDKASA